MTSEFEAYLAATLPQLRETYPQAKEREAWGQLRKLFVRATQDLSPTRRFLANFLLFPPRLQTPFIYWPSVSKEFKAVFQTDMYWRDVGLHVVIPNPDLTQQRRTVLQLNANGIRLSFTKKFNPVGENFYQVACKMEKDSPLLKHPDTVPRAEYFTRKMKELSGNSTWALEFLEHTARFTIETLRTKGFTKGEAILP